MSRLSFTLALLTAVSTPSFAKSNLDTPVASDPVGADRIDIDIDIDPIAPSQLRIAPSQLRIAPSQLRIAPPVIDRAQLRAKLLEARRANLAAFHAYRIGGVYPSNVFTSTLGNIWRDQDGHYCAAATIIRASGQVALVEQIAEDNNFFRIVDVEQGPVMDWILTSGLTQAELVMIQKPFRPVTQKPELDPPTKLAIDARLRAAETRRLAKLYKTIEQKLARSQRSSLEVAVDRLMRRPDLARQLLASNAS